MHTPTAPRIPAEPAANPFVTGLDAVMNGLEAAERRLRAAEAERVRWLARAFDLAAAQSRGGEHSVPTGGTAEIAYRAVRAEAATALASSERAVERQMSHAHTLTRNFPSTFEAFEEGLISHRHTTVIVEAAGVIGDGDDPSAVLRRHAYERRALEIALDETPGRLQPIARSLAERYAQVSIDERHAEASRLRRVYVVDREHGMADLIAHLPAAEAHGIRNRLTRAARALRAARGDAGAASGGVRFAPVNASADATAATGVGVSPAAPADIRTRDEVRADLLVDLLLSSRGADSPTGIGPSHPADENADFEARPTIGEIQAQVRLVVPVDSLVSSPRFPPSAPKPSELEGIADVHPPPALLEGYGPVDAEQARRLVGTAPAWDRVSVSPIDGGVLSVDRYRPSEQMRRLLGARDRRCRFPGCRVPADRCDIDHTRDAALGGTTSTDNLAHLCRGHHTLKHHSPWRVRQRAGGVLEWTSPTGRTRVDRPEPNLVPLRPVPDPF